jgi:hypothetical protein
MDTLYYSNYCKHSQKVLQFLVKGNLANQLNFLCIDKRERDPNNNQMYIVLENGKRVIMPPNVQSVPSLLLVKSNYRVILGDEIIKHYQPKVQQNIQNATSFTGEPTGVSMQVSNQGMNIVSEQYTFYNLTPDELSAKGNGGRRQMYNYVPASQDNLFIQTPPDTYQPDKVANNITVDVIQQKRNEDIQHTVAMNSPFVPKI